MSSRDDILARVLKNASHDISLPDLERIGSTDERPLDRFMHCVEIAAGTAIRVSSSSLRDTLSELLAEAKSPASAEAIVDIDVRSVSTMNQRELDSVDLLICRGTLGVAENGAVWLTESQMGHRAAPFLTEYLVLILNEEQIVATMHDAYKRIDIAEEGFGLFIAGPSKTADIEQSLVIGAHGPRRHTVLIVRQEPSAG